MRIAVLAHLRHPIAEPYEGGLEAHTATTVTELVRRGHQVTLFARSGSMTPATLISDPGHERVWGRAREGGVDAAELAADHFYAGAFDLVRDGAFDAVLNNTLSPVPYQARPGVPMLTVLHTPATLQRVNAVLEQPGWRPRRRHRFVAVSETTRRDWSRVLPVVATVPNGIDLAQWRSTTAVRRADVAPHAVWSGRITPEKGLHVAIEAARTAGWRLEISGPVSNPTYFDDTIAPQLTDGVTYRGHLRHEALRAFLSNGTVLVFSPLWPEPFGLAAVEAMACGTPVAALPAGAAAEVVSAAGGVLARDLSAAALADALVAAAQLDRARVRRSVLRFDAARMVRAYEAALLGGRARRPAALVQSTPDPGPDDPATVGGSRCR